MTDGTWCAKCRGPVAGYDTYCDGCGDTWEKTVMSNDPYPWEVSPLDAWSIVGMNHYHVAGEIHLFCAMTRNGRCIQAEGNCAEAVFNSLKSQAMLQVEE